MTKLDYINSYVKQNMAAFDSEDEVLRSNEKFLLEFEAYENYINFGDEILIAIKKYLENAYAQKAFNTKESMNKILALRCDIFERMVLMYHNLMEEKLWR